MVSNDELRAAGEFQARLCRENGSPTYAAIVDELARRLDGTSSHPALEMLRADDREPVESALYLRLLGAAHRVALALDDETCSLRAYLPSAGGTVDPAAAVPSFFDVVDRHTEAIAVGMQAGIQTNEVGRAPVLSAAMNHIAAAVGPRLRLLEIGASAGLNLSLDRFRVIAGARAWGPADSPLQLGGHFLDGDPPDVGFVVTERRGCDSNPLDLNDPADRLLLRSFVWPEQVERLRRLDQAIALALAGEPVVVDHDDATAWTARHVADLPADVTTVLFHSVVLPYLGSDGRHELATLLRAAGERADADHRLAWISYEYSQEHDTFCLVLSLWPGRQAVVLATGNPHGRDLRWLAGN